MQKKWIVYLYRVQDFFCVQATGEYIVIEPGEQASAKIQTLRVCIFASACPPWLYTYYIVNPTTNLVLIPVKLVLQCFSCWLFCNCTAANTQKCTEQRSKKSLALFFHLCFQYMFYSSVVNVWRYFYPFLYIKYILVFCSPELVL